MAASSPSSDTPACYAFTSEEVVAVGAFGSPEAVDNPQLYDRVIDALSGVGISCFSWKSLRKLLIHRIQQKINWYVTTYADMPATIVKEQTDGIVANLMRLEGPPFTLQRIADLLKSPEVHYKKTSKYIHAVEKSVNVTRCIKEQSLAEYEAAVAELLKRKAEVEATKEEHVARSDTVPLPIDDMSTPFAVETHAVPVDDMDTSAVDEAAVAPPQAHAADAATANPGSGTATGAGAPGSGSADALMASTPTMEVTPQVGVAGDDDAASTATTTTTESHVTPMQKEAPAEVDSMSDAVDEVADANA